jgi:glycosyltransferase involved in cell wall biosynthesis
MAVGRAGRWALLPEHRVRVWSAWCGAAGVAARREDFDVVHAHDFNTLELGAALADERGAALVYDSHEWWSGRQRHGRPSPVLTRREARVERRLLGRADAVVTVSQGIADRLGGWHGRAVSVVRNTFPGRQVVPVRHTALDRPRGLVYAGRLGAGRDLETVLAGAGGLRVVLMGSGDDGYLRGLRRGESVQVRPAVPVDEVDGVFQEHGLCVVPLTDSCANHRMALPNKLFQAVRAGVPVVAADLPELRAVVRRHDLGELYRPGSARSFRLAVERVGERFPEVAASVRRASAELCWERDAQVLLGVYGELAGRASR